MILPPLVFPGACVSVCVCVCVCLKQQQKGKLHPKMFYYVKLSVACTIKIPYVMAGLNHGDYRSKLAHF